MAIGTMEDTKQDVDASAAPAIIADERLNDFDFQLPLRGRADSAGEYLSEQLRVHYTKYDVGALEGDVLLTKIYCRPSPFGDILHGGTSLAIAETVAGFGSMLICHVRGWKLSPVGVTVTGNHISMATRGERLLMRAHALQQGQRLHLWNVDLLHENGKLVSSMRVTNALISIEMHPKRRC